MKISERDNKTKAIQTFKEYETDVVVILTRDKVACSLIREAKNLDFKWPEYAWILLDVDFHSSLETSLEGVILLRDQTLLAQGSTNYHARCFFNSSIFINSILAIASAHGNNASFSGVNGQIKFSEGKRLINISIAQIYSFRSRKEIAIYDTELQQLNVLSSFSVAGDKPRGTILKINFRDQNYTLRITLVMLLSLFLFIFVTIVLILYICFRKEPEVKATSVTVSLSMFLGCYILILYMPLLVLITENHQCNLILWLSLGGIPLPLIIATLFVKVLRIYLIFCDPHSFKKKLFTDPFLFLYILFLMSPSILILTI